MAHQPGPYAHESTATMQQPELIPAEPTEEGSEYDNDSAYGDVESSTASLSSSVLQYRTIQGRTFHSERYNTQYFTPNDERQRDSVDLTHHYLTLLLDGKLFLAPVSRNNMQKVLDVGTGTGIWAMDFADEYPNAEVIGIDISPIQPVWIPPNLKFEVDDATEPWTWADNTFDFVHIRYLFGAIADWSALFREAYRCCKPGGWVQSCECDVSFHSDDGTTDNVPALETWHNLYAEGGQKLGRPFFLLDEEVQNRGMEDAGLVDIQRANYKLPVGGWPRDTRMKEVGRFVQLTLENDIEGYTLFLWNSLLGWGEDERQLFMMEMRKALRNPRIHGYMRVRYVYGASRVQLKYAQLFTDEKSGTYLGAAFG